jgi:hypothetical protein
MSRRECSTCAAWSYRQGAELGYCTAANSAAAERSAQGRTVRLSGGQLVTAPTTSCAQHLPKQAKSSPPGGRSALPQSGRWRA